MTPDVCRNCGHDSPHVQQMGDECWCGCVDLPGYRYYTITLRVSDDDERGRERADGIRSAATHGCNPIPVVMREELSPPTTDPDAAWGQV